MSHNLQSHSPIPLKPTAIMAILASALALPTSLVSAQVSYSSAPIVSITSLYDSRNLVSLTDAPIAFVGHKRPVSTQYAPTPTDLTSAPSAHNSPHNPPHNPQSSTEHPMSAASNSLAGPPTHMPEPANMPHQSQDVLPQTYLMASAHTHPNPIVAQASPPPVPPPVPAHVHIPAPAPPVPIYIPRPIIEQVHSHAPLPVYIEPQYIYPSESLFVVQPAPVYVPQIIPYPTPVFLPVPVPAPPAFTFAPNDNCVSPCSSQPLHGVQNIRKGPTSYGIINSKSRWR